MLEARRTASLSHLTRSFCRGYLLMSEYVGSDEHTGAQVLMKAAIKVFLSRCCRNRFLLFGANDSIKFGDFWPLLKIKKVIYNGFTERKCITLPFVSSGLTKVLPGDSNSYYLLSIYFSRRPPHSFSVARVVPSSRPILSLTKMTSSSKALTSLLYKSQCRVTSRRCCLVSKFPLLTVPRVKCGDRAGFRQCSDPCVNPAGGVFVTLLICCNKPPSLVSPTPLPFAYALCTPPHPLPPAPFMLLSVS